MSTRREQDELIVAQLQGKGEYWYFLSDAGAYFDMVGIVHNGKVIRMPMPKASKSFGQEELLDEYGFKELVGYEPVMSMTVRDEIVYSDNQLGDLMARIADNMRCNLNWIVFKDGSGEISITDTEVAPGQVPNLRVTYNVAPYGVYAVEHDGNPQDYNSRLYFMPRETAKKIDMLDLFMASRRLL